MGGPFTETPSLEQEANPQPDEEGWDNETGLQAAFFSTWGRSFCSAHRVGAFCHQFTWVRCCRTSWGYDRCGNIARSSRCGWRRGYGGGGAWRIHPFTSAVVKVEEQNHMDSGSDDVPDEAMDFDSVGPFTETPSPEQEANPQPAKEGWDNETGLQAAFFSTWGRSFCSAHRVGAFCHQFTWVRCCRTSWGYDRCGNIAR